ncbi:hypothetical protein [Kribbella italica]|uniref:Uncharacterized protein n=1 Tax=Kribbella italica TaxID=1540520 RepID=A0A7W9MXV5_9ACTN|nr:hypothetical protein [Kribbella italica]MBB5840194.1 hypothetical protein [Kribbella italica]
MTKSISNRSTSTQHDTSNEPISNPKTHSAAASSPNPTEKVHQSHPCITIKWSRDSASRRRFGLPPAAAVGAFGPVAGRAVAGGAAWR